MRDAIDLAKVIATRSRGNPARPRLPASYEAALDEVERKSAACYAAIEMMSMRFHQIADRIRGESGMNGKVEEPLSPSESTMIQIEELRQKTGR